MSPNTPIVKLLKGRNALVLAVATAIGATTLNAAPTRAPKPAGAPAAPRVEGLDGLDERAVGAELSSRGLDSLLDHYFKINNTPEADRRAMKTVGALGELNKTTLKFNEKLRRVREVADGIDAVLPTLKDPLRILAAAATIKEFGIDPEVDSLEYWGEDSVTQAHLKPFSVAIIKLFGAATTAASKEADRLSHLPLQSDKAAKEYDKMEDLSRMADYSKNMSVYFDCLATPAKALVNADTHKILTAEEAKALPKEKVTDRKKMAEEAITNLKAFDNEDSMIQPRIRNMMGKLSMVMGDFGQAREMFSSVITAKYENKPEGGGKGPIVDMKPAPNAFEQYEARYFSVVCDVLKGDLASAIPDKKDLDTWQTSALPGLLVNMKLTDEEQKASAKGVAASGQLLQWRIDVLAGDQAQAAGKAKEKKDADDAAEAVLLNLKTLRPELSERIDQQLVNRMPANKPIDASMPGSVLLALMNKGLGEAYKADADKRDAVVMKKGIEAAQAIVASNGKGLSAARVSESRLALGTLNEGLGNDVDAVNAYLDFTVSDFKLEPKKATDAMEQAGFLLFNKMIKLTPKPAGYEAAFKRFLPIAIGPPFNRKDLSYLQGEQLRMSKDFAEAVQFLREVPKDNPMYANAQFKIMLSLDAMLDPEQNPKAKDLGPERAKRVEELKKAAQVVIDLHANPKDNYERTRVVQAIFIIANQARIEKDANRTIAVLADLEKVLNGMTPEAGLDEKKASALREARRDRVHAFIQLKKFDEAVTQVIDLVSKSTDGSGMSLVADLVDTFETEYNEAVAKVPPDVKGMEEARKNGAALTGFLVKFADPATQKSPSVVEQYYTYALYDARMQREAGTLTADPAARKALLEKAKAAYTALQAPPMKARYLAQPDVVKAIQEKKIDKNDDDPQVAVGLALSSFDLGDFKTARELLLPLTQFKKLGDPMINNAQGQPVINDLYWDGTYDYIYSGYQLAKNNPTALAAVVTDLKIILIRGGVPNRWADDYQKKFLALRDLIAPGFDPDAKVKPKK